MTTPRHLAALFVLAACATPGPPVAAPRPNASDARVFFRYAHTWDQPIDDQAVEQFRVLAATAPTWEAFAHTAPAGSHARWLIEHFMDQFEQAGVLMQAGALRRELYLDMWYDVEGFWNKAAPWIAGMRAASQRPDLYARFEWLARARHEFAAQYAQAPPTWPPLETRPANAEEVMVFFDFAALWQSERDREAEEFVTRLATEAPDVETFKQRVPRGSHEWTMFDRVFCETDQAGTLVKRGILRTDLAALVRDPVKWWDIGKKWIVPLRAEYPGLYADTELLAARVLELRAKAR
jgi:hypothetical protein